MTSSLSLGALVPMPTNPLPAKVITSKLSKFLLILKVELSLFAADPTPPTMKYWWVTAPGPENPRALPLAPSTWNLMPGAVVPTPTFPLPRKVIKSTLSKFLRILNVDVSLLTADPTPPVIR